MYSIFKDYSEVLELISVDEAFSDVPNEARNQGRATLIAKEICERVLLWFGITALAGVASVRYLAKNCKRL